MNYDLVILCSGCSKVGESIPIEAANARPRLREAMIKLLWKSTGTEMWCPDCAPKWKDFTDEDRLIRRVLETRTHQMRALAQELYDAKLRIEEFEVKSQPFDGPPTLNDVSQMPR